MPSRCLSIDVNDGYAMTGRVMINATTPAAQMSLLAFTRNDGRAFARQRNPELLKTDHAGSFTWLGRHDGQHVWIVALATTQQRYELARVHGRVPPHQIPLTTMQAATASGFRTLRIDKLSCVRLGARSKNGAAIRATTYSVAPLAATVREVELHDMARLVSFDTDAIRDRVSLEFAGLAAKAPDLLLPRAAHSVEWQLNLGHRRISFPVPLPEGCSGIVDWPDVWTLRGRCVGRDGQPRPQLVVFATPLPIHSTGRPFPVPRLDGSFELHSMRIGKTTHVTLKDFAGKRQGSTRVRARAGDSDFRVETEYPAPPWTKGK